jgi:hypothetical protein
MGPARNPTGKGTVPPAGAASDALAPETTGLAGALDALVATGATWVEAVTTLFSGGVGRQEVAVALLDRLEGSSAERALAIVRGLGACCKGAPDVGGNSGETLGRILRARGLHPLCVAAGMLTTSPSPQPADLLSAERFLLQNGAERSGPFVVLDGCDLNRDVGINIHPGTTVWPEGLRVVPGAVWVYERSLGALPEGLAVEAILDLKGGSVRSLPSGLTVGFLRMSDCPKWDGIIPDDTVVTGHIYVEARSHSMIEKRFTLAEWRARTRDGAGPPS